MPDLQREATVSGAPPAMAGRRVGALRLTLLLLKLLCMAAGSALAHGVVVWTERAGDKVLVEAHFTSGKGLADARVVVLDGQGRTACGRRARQRIAGPEKIRSPLFCPDRTGGGRS